MEKDSCRAMRNLNLDLGLSSFGSNPVISELEAASNTTMLSNEIDEFKARLVKESLINALSSGIDSSHMNNEEIKSQILGPPMPDWLLHRPYLSLNFVISEKVIDVIAPLGEVAVNAQEQQLLEDILSLMTGCQGTNITVSYSDENSHSPIFTIDSSVEPSLRALVSKILPLCRYYSIVISFIEEKSQYYQGTVNHALSAAMRNLLKDYMLLVTQLESQQMQGTLTLHRLWFYVEKTITLMEMLANLSSSISKLKSYGGEVLSILHEKMLSLTGCGQLQDIVIYLTQAAAVPYMKMLTRWISRGIIVDPYNEFMVTDNEGTDANLNCSMIETGRNELTDYYWEKRYVVQLKNIPSFLQSHADMILRTGKYLNVIRESDPSVVCPEQEVLIYSAKDKRYLENIEKTYNFASKRLLQLLMKEKDLMGHLKSVKHYFLLDQGDFVVQLLNLCEAELLKNIDDVVPTRLESLLELALRTSAANVHAYKDYVHCALLPYNLKSQMMQILSIETEDEREYRNPPERLHLTGIEGFSLTYNVEWPLSLVLDCRSHFCYQMIFRHLFYCKYVEGLLCRVWISNKVAKSFPLSSSATYTQAFTLRQRMLYFIQNLEYYMNFEVIERNWQNFITKIQKVENIDEVIVYHSDFLNGCLQDCMLTSPELLRIVLKLTNICVTFANFILRMRKYCDEAEADFWSGGDCRDPGEGSESPEPSHAFTSPEASESFEQTIARLDLQFTAMLVTLVDRISDMGRENYSDALIHVVYRLDFNNYYTKKSESLHVCSSSESSLDYVNGVATG